MGSYPIYPEKKVFHYQDLERLGFVGRENTHLRMLYERDDLSIAYDPIAEKYTICGPHLIYSGRISNRLLLRLIFHENNIPWERVGEAVSDSISSHTSITSK